MRGEGGTLSRAFIGRHEEREQIKTRLAEDGIVLLFGQPLVGKASLARQVAEELRDEQEGTPLCVYVVDCKDAANWPDIMLAMCRAFSFEETAANENRLVNAISQRVPSNGEGRLLLLLLRVHKLKPSGTDVQSMTRCLQSLTDVNVMTMVTSRRQLYFPVVQRVSPLTKRDAMQLLRHRAPGISVEDFAELLELHCHGLPPLVLQMARLVGAESFLADSAAELREELEENPGLLMEGLEEEAQLAFSTLSPEVQRHVSTLAQLLDGSFSLEALKAAVGVEGARVKTVLRRLHDEAPLIIDRDQQRMRLEPLVLHHIRQLGHVTADDQARLRVVTLLGRVLTRAENELYVAGQDTVYGHLHGDWPQLQHVLRQAIHCTTNTYQAYLQVAMKAERLLAKCFPQEALTFYHNMAYAAVRFGTSRDVAVIQGLIGMAVVCGQGTGWQEALQHFHSALPVLQQERQSVTYLRLLCDLGFSYFRLHRLQESEKYLQEAVSVSHVTNVEDEQELIFHLIRARSFLALPSIFKGQLVQSKALLLETLELCEQYAPNHPDKPVLINSLGLVYERSGEDQDKALQYYRQSLVERRRYAAVAPGDMVPTLNNVGMQYSRRGDYETAMIYLEEAAAIRARDNRWHYYTALTEQHLGQVAIQQGDIRRAERHLQEAACVYGRCTPYHDVRLKVDLCLAHLYITPELWDLRQAKRYLQQVCKLAEDIEQDLSDSGLVVLLSALQHRLQLQDWTAGNLTSQLRWAQQLLSNFEGDRSQALACHQSIMHDVISTLGTGVTEAWKEAVRPRVIDQCQMCGAMAMRKDPCALWRHAEQTGHDLRGVIDRLRQSTPLRDVLNLLEEPRSHPSAPSQKMATENLFSGQAVRDQERKLETAQQACEELPAPGRSIQLHPVTPSGTERRKEDADLQVHLHPLNPTPDPGGRQDEVRPQFPLQSFPRRVSEEAGGGRTGGGPACKQREDRVWNEPGSDPKAALDRAGRHGQDFSNFHPSSDNFPGRGMTTHRGQRRSSDGLHSCSFTSSEPPSTTHTDVTSTGSVDSAEHGVCQQEQVTLCERFIFPLQETARVHDNSGCEADPDLHPGFSLQDANVQLYAQSPPGLAERGSHPQLQGQVSGGVMAAPPPGNFVDLSGFPKTRTLTSESRPSQLSPRDNRSPHSTCSSSEREERRGQGDINRNRLVAISSSNPGSGTAEPVWPPSSEIHHQDKDPGHSVLPPASSERTPHTGSSLTFPPASGSSPAEPPTVPDLHPSLEAAKPRVTPQNLATCAQQLMFMIPAVTSEQRKALEKLASLTADDVREGSPQHAVFDDQSLRSLMSLGDQAAKMALLQGQRAHRAQESDQSTNRAHETDQQARTAEGRNQSEYGTQQFHQSSSCIHPPNQQFSATPLNQFPPDAKQLLVHTSHPSQEGKQLAGSSRDVTTVVTEDQLAALSKLSPDRQQRQTTPDHKAEREVTDEQYVRGQREATSRVTHWGPVQHGTRFAGQHTSDNPETVRGVTHGLNTSSVQPAGAGLIALSETQQEVLLLEASARNRAGAALFGSGSSSTAGGVTYEEGVAVWPPDVRGQVTEHPGAGLLRRQPMESDENEELDARPRVVPGWRRVSGFGREATENDERMEHPDHVCHSADCSCSLRQAPLPQ